MDKEIRKDLNQPISEEEAAQAAGGGAVKLQWKCVKCGQTYKKAGVCHCGGKLKPEAEHNFI